MGRKPKKEGIYVYIWGFQLALVVKNTLVSARDRGGMGSIPGSGRSPGGGNGNPLQYYCHEISWTDESGGLQSMGSQRVGHE